MKTVKIESGQFIWKYPIKLTDFQEIEMPLDAQILSVQASGENIFLWALVTPSLPSCTRRIHIYGTGNYISSPSDKPSIFLGAVQISIPASWQPMVWHIFEVVQ